MSISYQNQSANNTIHPTASVAALLTRRVMVGVGADKQIRRHPRSSIWAGRAIKKGSERLLRECAMPIQRRRHPRPSMRGSSFIRGCQGEFHPRQLLSGGVVVKLKPLQRLLAPTSGSAGPPVQCRTSPAGSSRGRSRYPGRWRGSQFVAIRGAGFEIHPRQDREQ